MFRALIVLILATASVSASASDAASVFPFQFRNAEIVDAVQAYSKITGQKFVVNANTKGKITIINTSKVTAEEAFNLLSSALATNDLGISQQGDTMVVSEARSTQRDAIPVVTELPSMKPQRMVSWVVEFKHIDADEVNRQLRMITSRDGECFPFGKNRFIVTDWISNLYRVRDLFAQIDKADYQPIVRKEAKANPEK